MRIYILTYLFAPLLVFTTHRVLSQEASFNKVIPPLGNFSNLVGGIAQDKNGYMWFATAGGLYRYDGYKFKMYAHNVNDKNSISAQRLETVYPDSKGIIWMATWVNGMDRLDPVTGEFTHFQHDPRDPASLSSDSAKSIMEDRDGNLWIGTNAGIDMLDPKTGKFKNYRHDPKDLNTLSCNHVRRIVEDKDGAIWVATGTIWGEGCKESEGGLNRFDKKTGKVVRYLHDPKDPFSLFHNKVQGLYEDSRGTLWVGTADNGLQTLDRKTGKFTRHSLNLVQPEKPIAQSEFTPHITFITEDELGGIWIGTLFNGLAHYDPKSGKTFNYANERRSDGFNSRSGWSCFNSRDGVLWIGTFEGELYKLDPYHKNIQFVPTNAIVNSINEDQNNNLWIGTDKGLIIKGKNSGIFTHDSNNTQSLSHDIVRSIFRDKNGTMWVGTIGGLNRFNSQTKTFTRYQHDNQDPNSIISDSIYTLAETGDDSLWIGGRYSLSLMDKRTGKFKEIKSNGLSLDAITALLKDKSGNLWIGRYVGGGLYQLPVGADTFRIILGDKWITSLKEDSQNNLLIATEGEGLHWRNNLTGSVTQFTDPRIGIENMSIAAVEEDNEGNLWASAFYGILKIDPKTNHTIAFSTNEGVRINGLRYSTGYKDSRGLIYFGADDGYYVISPADLTGNPRPPQIVITDIRVGGKSIQNDKAQLGLPVEGTENITYDYDQTSLSISFSGIHFSNPNLNRHRFMLENYDLDWRDAEIEKTADYSNLPPGQYRFVIKAASSSGVGAEKAIIITVTPPWWRTLWAYITYGLVLVGGIYGVDRIQRGRVIRIERKKAQARELSHAKEIEKAYTELKITQSQLIQSEKMASLGELTAGIAHEIQNPLNFVNNFSELNKELLDDLKTEVTRLSKGQSAGDRSSADDLINNLKENEDKISHHGKRADAIVKNMLQHSRKSTGQKEPTDLNALCEEYLRLAYHGIRAKDKNFKAEFQTSLDPSVGKVSVIAQEIGRVFLNLINNAFYAVAEKSRLDHEGYEPIVSVTTRRLNQRVEIRVKDNGNGIAPSVIEKIFQPFFTTKPTGQGTGLGLSLAYDIITKGHGGELKVESPPGGRPSKEGESLPAGEAGCEFIILLPLLKNS